LDFENLRVPPAAVPWLFAGLLLAWLALRVHLLRGRLAVREPDEPLPPASGLLLALARSHATLPALLILVATCGAAVVLAFR
jgi:hypothetical protein